MIKKILALTILLCFMGMGQADTPTSPTSTSVSIEILVDWETIPASPIRILLAGPVRDYIQLYPKCFKSVEDEVTSCTKTKLYDSISDISMPLKIEVTYGLHQPTCNITLKAGSNVVNVKILGGTHPSTNVPFVTCELSR